jgi:hypothetical protein
MVSCYRAAANGVQDPSFNSRLTNFSQGGKPVVLAARGAAAARTDDRRLRPWQTLPGDAEALSNMIRGVIRV